MAKAKTAAEKKADKAARELAQNTGANKPPAPTNLKDAPVPKDEERRDTIGIVARGRTVHDRDERGRTVIAKPGEQVRGTKSEIARLRKLGFLVDPARELLPLGNGPKFFQEDAAAAGAKEPQG